MIIRSHHPSIARKCVAEERLSKATHSPTSVVMADRNARLEARAQLMVNDWFRDGVFGFAFRVGLNMLQLVIGGLAIIWLSVFIYIGFYYKYIPTVMNSREVHLQYDSRCDPKTADQCCNIPFAELSFSAYDFDRGQTYHFFLDMVLPESEVNWAQGMFMVRLKLLDHKNQTVVNVAKPTGLKYKSIVLRTIHILFFWPLMILGLTDENQHISVTLMDDFVEGSYAGLEGPYVARLEFEVRDIQIYPPTKLRIGAALSGLRYYMYYWWPLSFFMGTTTISFFLYFSTLLAFTNRLRRQQQNQELLDMVEYIDDDNDINGQRVAQEVNHPRIDADSSGLTGDLDDVHDNETSEAEVARQVDELDRLAQESEDIAESIEQEVDRSSNDSDVSSTVVIQEHDETLTL